MNNKKIAFIICTNNSLMYEECLKYIQLLIVPENYQVDIIAVKDAKSMLAGMDEGRSVTDAKYKIFMHQDVFILNKYFLQNILDIFAMDSGIGLIGMIGSSDLPKNGIMWNGTRKGNLFTEYSKDLKYCDFSWKVSDGVMDVNVVDGLMMITAYDLPFRKDVFDAWDFYDLSTSMEYKKAGYRVVVPSQSQPWCVHDDGIILSVWDYNKYRKLFLEIYRDMLS